MSKQDALFYFYCASICIVLFLLSGKMIIKDVFCGPFYILELSEDGNFPLDFKICAIV